MHPWTKAGLNASQLTLFEEGAVASLGSFDDRLVELAPLKKVDVLASNGRKLIAKILAAM
jgi:hypothetical protein